jgi:hypothetical protein
MPGQVPATILLFAIIDYYATRYEIVFSNVKACHCHITLFLGDTCTHVLHVAFACGTPTGSEHVNELHM